MEERAQKLWRRIALYRRYLAEGVDAELALEYLRALAGAGAELADLEQRTERRE
jgi:hypothetical protein